MAMIVLHFYTVVAPAINSLLKRHFCYQFY